MSKLSSGYKKRYVSRVTAKVLRADTGDFLSLVVKGLINVFVSDEAFINDTPIPVSLARSIIESVRPDRPIALHLGYIEYEADLMLEVGDYGLRVTQGDREIFAIEFHGDRAVILTPEDAYEIEHTEGLRESLRHGVTAYVY